MKKMKKIFIIILTFFIGITLTGCMSEEQTTATTEETLNIDFDFYNFHMYDFETGEFISNNNYAVTSRERVFTEDIILNNYSYINYIMCWGKNNYYIGYISTTGGINTYDTYIDNQANNTIDLPTGTEKTGHRSEQ